jgi:hypothetical protein
MVWPWHKDCELCKVFPFPISDCLSCHKGGQAPFFFCWFQKQLTLSHKSSHSEVQNDGVHRANIRRSIIIAILRGPIVYWRVNSDNTVLRTGGSRRQWPLVKVLSIDDRRAKQKETNDRGPFWAQIKTPHNNSTTRQDTTTSSTEIGQPEPKARQLTIQNNRNR